MILYWSNNCNNLLKKNKRLNWIKLNKYDYNYLLEKLHLLKKFHKISKHVLEN